MYVLSWAFWNGKAWTESIMASDSSLEKPRVRGFGSKEISARPARPRCPYLSPNLSGNRFWMCSAFCSQSLASAEDVHPFSQLVRNAQAPK